MRECVKGVKVSDHVRLQAGACRLSFKRVQILLGTCVHAKRFSGPPACLFACPQAPCGLGLLAPTAARLRTRGSETELRCDCLGEIRSLDGCCLSISIQHDAESETVVKPNLILSSICVNLRNLWRGFDFHSPNNLYVRSPVPRLSKVRQIAPSTSMNTMMMPNAAASGTSLTPSMP